MKKMMLLVSAWMFASGLHAQEVFFGIKGGLNVANLTNLDNNDALLSFHAGGLAHIHFDEHIAVQPELYFSGQGTRFNNGSSADTRVNLGYINIPILLQYMTGDGFRLETGPQFGLLASAKSKTGNVTVNSKKSFKTGDVAWVFGASYLSSSGIGISARYHFGLSDISDSNAANVKNRVFGIGLFYLLGSN